MYDTLEHCRVEKSDLTVQDLHALGFKEKLAEVSTAVSVGRNVAVVSESFAGRNAVLDYVEISNKDINIKPFRNDQFGVVCGV